MSADRFDLHRIELDADTSVWVRARPRRVPRIRPVAAAAAAAAAGVSVAVLGPTREGLLAAWTLAVLTILAAIDLEVRLLPNRIVLPAILAAIAWQAVFSPDRLVECLIAGVCAGVMFLLPALVRPGAVGMGDVKVAAFLGFVLGADVVAALLAGSLLSAPVALALLLVNGAGARRAALPFGPFLALGAAITLLPA